ncbi:hypothetical protein MYX77_00940 [Acidobacteriia bacterium AH_259_A11_L15]|nr:hypothetical protein [Acidobacteriia bacterium AH_259_A11_L15]
MVELASSVSGFPIILESDPTLQVWSATRYPRKGEKVCLIAYHPAHARYLDYLVAHECGHIYRFFSARPEDRLVPATNPETLRKAIRQLHGETWKLKNYVSNRRMKEFLECLCSGLVRQLTNTPADCRIEAWIHNNFEPLRDIQASALRELYATSIKCLDPEIEKWTPPSIYKKTNSMNYVLAKATSKLLNEPGLIAPYREEGFAEIGEKLDSYMAETDRGYVNDIRVADAWAKELGIAGWYEWTRLE